MDWLIFWTLLLQLVILVVVVYFLSIPFLIVRAAFRASRLSTRTKSERIQ